MKKVITVRAIWEFEFDADGYDEKHVDIIGLAKDSTKRELQYLINNNDISADDFIYFAIIPPEYNKETDINEK